MYSKSYENNEVHLTILVGRMLPIITHGRCWTCTAITTVSFEDLKNVRCSCTSLKLHPYVSGDRAAAKGLASRGSYRSVKNRNEVIENVT